MTDRELNIKIAELCGWKSQSRTDGILEWNPPTGHKDHGFWVRGDNVPPNYSADLNAMHSAERFIGLGQLSKYMWLLSDRAKLTYMDVARDDWAGVHATARQRAEAFVKAMEDK
jgi:hypothetical protein